MAILGEAGKPVTHINWLHLSDLRISTEVSPLFEPEIRAEMERDLRELQAVAGPWDAVIVTGNLTQNGDRKEFDRVELIFEWLFGYLAQLGSSPVLLAVPGASDAHWNRSKSEARLSEERTAAAPLYRLSQVPSPMRTRLDAVRLTFGAFSEWYGKRRPAAVRPGRVTGDFTYAFERGDRRLTVLGLNSAFLHGGPGDTKGRFDVDMRLSPEAPVAHACLIVVHQPIRLHDAARHELEEVASMRPTLYLCADAHEKNLPAPTLVYGAPSLFGHEKLPSGYCAGRVEFDSRRFSFWPRVFRRSTAGGLIAGPDLSKIDRFKPIRLPWPARPTSSFGKSPSERTEPPPSTAPKEYARLIGSSVAQRWALGTESTTAVWPAWSPDGSRVALGHADGTVVIWNLESGTSLQWGKHHQEPVLDVAWSRDGKRIASISSDCVHVADIGREETLMAHAGPGQGRCGTAWHPKLCDMLAWHGSSSHVNLWQRGWIRIKRIEAESRVLALAWSPDGSRIALAGAQAVELKPIPAGIKHKLRGVVDVVLDLAWEDSGKLLAAAQADGCVAVWNALREDPRPIVILTAHTDAVTSLSFSFDGRLLATKSHDGTVRLWRTDTWEVVTTIDESKSRHFYGGLAFSPVDSTLATIDGSNLRIWDLDIDTLLRSASTAPRTVHSISAKVVLVGEGSAGKSCLAMRLAEDRYEDLGATHGMRFWRLPAERLEAPAQRAIAPDEEREVVLWDLGGQSEYRLVHQLFFGDTTAALMVMEPRRGQPALDEIAVWDKRLEKQHALRPIRKILVGAKLDDEHVPADRPAIDEFVRRMRLDAYVPTSAKEGRGINELRDAIARSIVWSELGRTSQPELFHRIRRAIQAEAQRRVVLPFGELEKSLREEDPAGYDPEAVRAVVRQLALQGSIADSRLADGTRALVLQVEQIERYAGSVIVTARSHPRGIAAVDLSALLSPAVKLPRLGDCERLRRDQELVVLDCVVELLLQHGLCIRHEGLLVFPSLFQPTEHDPSFPHAVALYYEFAGAVDNTYASLVTSLAVSRAFGPVRLWEDRAEFSRAGQGTAGVRRSQRGEPGARGIARLDVYFDDGAPDATRELFVGYVEEHLCEHGIEILERLSMTCSCGCELPETAVRARMEQSLADIGCPKCDARLPLTLGAGEARERNLDLDQKVRALKTTVLDRTKKAVTETKVNVSEILRAHAAAARAPVPPVRVLHLSDLHVQQDADIAALLQPLMADLEDRTDGLGLDRLDLLVVSGDVTSCASPAEFEKAHALISGLVARFGLTAERCILVPGNHDLDWNEPVYRTVKKRAADSKLLQPGRFKEQGELYEIRDEALYSNRFRSFSQYFYHPLVQEPYPLPPEQQCIPLLFPDLGLQFLALNSAWEIDEYFPARSGIHPGALARGIAQADVQVTRARQDARFAPDAALLRIATWHHPITGNGKIEEDAFVEPLRKAGVRLCLHGHVHEDRADHVGYLHATRSLHVAGAGSFGAPARERPESVPRLYNVLEIERDHSAIRVHTRCLRKQTGAWEGWAVWPGTGPGERRTYYNISLAKS